MVTRRLKHFNCGFGLATIPLLPNVAADSEDGEPRVNFCILAERDSKSLTEGGLAQVPWCVGAQISLLPPLKAGRPSIIASAAPTTVFQNWRRK